MKSKARFDGYLMIDHRAGRGMKAYGNVPDVPGGTLYETTTLACWHCPTVVVMNKERVRKRAYCSVCDHYICDACDAVRNDPLYTHRTWFDVVDMVQSGRYALVGGSASAPILIPTKGANHGT